jgi:hypothetical protein
LGSWDYILDREGGAAPPNAGIAGELFRLSPVSRLLPSNALGEPDAGKGGSLKKDLFTLQDNSLSVLPFRAGKFSEIQIILSHRSPDDRVIENDHVLDAVEKDGIHFYLAKTR